MAAAKKKTIKLTGKPDNAAYGEFMRGLLDGSIQSNALTETTAPDGTRDVTLKQFDAQGNPLPDVVVTVPKVKLTKLEYDDLS